MSNSAVHGMSPAQARTAGRFSGNAGEPGTTGQPAPGPPARELDPALAGLLAWLPPAGGTLSRSAIERWSEAARAVLTLAYAAEED
ncbi:MULTISPECIES: hypothetical protein [Thermomonosporaceae]|uniref:hypothetical protein n=1 Tax=Thermomonosporaceae TaxID=2012 RepID=UPI00255A7940|nr:MULTISPECIES: hypothetical protein [Thermomonosporaceae]MDL4777427.1 hypothetical protein [Actinomadura xylanilytica]